MRGKKVRKMPYNAADGREVKLNTVPDSNAWNHFVFDLNLLAETPAATLSINGSEAEAIPVIASIGDYVCYVDINNKGLSGTWMDSFLVLDDDNSFVPETEEKIKEETKATIRCVPFETFLGDDKEPGKCMVTGKPSACRVLFARSY